MHDFFLLMSKPLLACLILTGIHTYLGIHVLERKVIFVDLALAQIAALGAVIGLVFGFDLHHPASYWFSLGATFLGALLFSATRTRREKIPQEAIIGIVYAVAAAGAILILSRAAEGTEAIQHMLVGNVLLVDTHEMIKMTILYAIIGGLHWRFRRNFFLISTAPEEAYQKGVSIKLWDMIFYLSFGFVVTSSVHIAGVLLVFSFLIVPAVGAILFTKSITHRLILGWILGTIGSALGIAVSYFGDLPTGATVVCILGVILMSLAIFKSFQRKRE